MYAPKMNKNPKPSKAVCEWACKMCLKGRIREAEYISYLIHNPRMLDKKSRNSEILIQFLIIVPDFCFMIDELLI